MGELVIHGASLIEDYAEIIVQVPPDLIRKHSINTLNTPEKLRELASYLNRRACEFF